MNKYIFVAFALFAVISLVRCSDSDEVLEKVKSRHLKQYLSQHKDRIDGGLEKLEEKCPGVSEKLKAAVKHFVECDDNADDSLTICEAVQTYTLNCTRPLLKVVDDCLPAKAKGLPTLGVKSLLSVADHLCKQTGESIFELANPCPWEDVEDPPAELAECGQKVQRIADKYKSEHTIPTQVEICSTLASFRSCIQTRISASCKNQKTRNSLLGVYDAALAPCAHINQV